MRFGQFISCTTVTARPRDPRRRRNPPRRGPTASGKAFSNTPPSPRSRGQRTIDDERATQIQAALIKAGYLSGTAQRPLGHRDPGRHGKSSG